MSDTFPYSPLSTVRHPSTNRGVTLPAMCKRGVTRSPLHFWIDDLYLCINHVICTEGFLYWCCSGPCRNRISAVVKVGEHHQRLHMPLILLNNLFHYRYNVHNRSCSVTPGCIAIIIISNSPSVQNVTYTGDSFGPARTRFW